MQEIVDEERIVFPTVIISIAERQSNIAYREKLKAQGRLAEVDFSNVEVDPGVPFALLEIAFDDVERSEDGGILWTEASKIADFVIDNVNILNDPRGRLMVNCAAGVSRSAAVVAAVLKWFYGTSSAIIWNLRYSPNQKVYDKVLDRLYDEDIRRGGA